MVTIVLTAVACIPAQALCLQLRRGHWEAAAGRHVKLRGPVAFPLYLDLTPFVGLAASSADRTSADAGPPASGARRQPRSSSSVGSIFLRQLDQVTSSVFRPVRNAGCSYFDRSALQMCDTLWYATVQTERSAEQPVLCHRTRCRQHAEQRGRRASLSTWSRASASV